MLNPLSYRGSQANMNPEKMFPIVKIRANINTCIELVQYLSSVLLMLASEFIEYRLTLLHSERLKLQRVLAVLSAVGLVGMETTFGRSECGRVKENGKD